MTTTQLHYPIISDPVCITKSIIKGTEPIVSDLDKTLSERGARYGKFTGHANISQTLKANMKAQKNWTILAADQKEALEMIAHKIGRILNGDPNYDDSWVDIGGYAKLVADRLATGKEA